MPDEMFWEAHEKVESLLQREPWYEEVMDYLKDPIKFEELWKEKKDVY